MDALCSRDGNLVEDRARYNEDGEVREEWMTYAYAEDAPANSGIFMPEYVMDADFMYYGGFYGRPTRSIPSSMT